MLGQVLLALGAGDLVDAVEHGLQRPELLQELGRGLVADPRDARDVVGGVPLQADQVRDELGRHAVALDHSVAVVDLGVGHSAGGGHDPHPVADHLVDVAIAGDDHHGDLRVAGAPNEASRSRRRPPTRPPSRCGSRTPRRAAPGAATAPRAGRAARVAGPCTPCTSCSRPDIPASQATITRLRPVLDQDLGHHRGEAVDRVRRPPVGRRDRLGQGEERPVGEAVAVDQEELAVASRRAASAFASASSRAPSHPRTGRLPPAASRDSVRRAQRHAPGAACIRSAPMPAVHPSAPSSRSRCGSSSTRARSRWAS